MNRKEKLPQNNRRGRKSLGTGSGPIRKHSKGGKINFASRQPGAFQNPFLKALIVLLAALPYLLISLVVIREGLLVLGVVMLFIPVFLLISFRIIYNLSQ